MKQSLVIFLAITSILFMVSCGDEEEKALNTEWILVEQLIDPGDGSGDFMPVTSDKTITLNPDSTYTSNGDVCNMSIDANAIGSTGSFDSEFFTPDSCDFNLTALRYELTSDELIINYPCFEPCKHKYVLK